MLKYTKNALIQTRKPSFLVSLKPFSSGTSQQPTNSGRPEGAVSPDGSPVSQREPDESNFFERLCKLAKDAKRAPEIHNKPRPTLPSSPPRSLRIHVPAPLTRPPSRKSYLGRLCAHIVHQIAKNPDDILPVIVEIKKLSSLDHRARAYEVASDELLRQKRPRPHRLLLQRMATDGISMTRAMHAKVVVPSLSSQGQDTDTDAARIRLLIYGIISEEEYTEHQFSELLKIMQFYPVDRGLVAKYVTHFRQSRESRGPYEPLPALIPAMVEALARENDVDRALTMLEKITVKQDDTWAAIQVEKAYIRILHALGEMHAWDLGTVERIKHGIVQHRIDSQSPTRLLLSWAAHSGLYASVADIYTEFKNDPDLVLDTDLGIALFEIHRNATNISIAELAPRRLFFDIARAAMGPAPTVHPNARLVKTMLAAFMHQQDYAAAIVVLRTFGAYGASWTLTNGMFGAVIKPLMDRILSDDAVEGEVRWGERFLGTPLCRIHRADKFIHYMADQAARESFSITDPVGTLTRLDAMLLPPDSEEQSSVVLREPLEAAWGALVYKLPDPPQSRSGQDTDTRVYSSIPLERLLLRAIFAAVMPLEGEQALGVQKVWDIVRRAEEEMLPRPTAEQPLSPEGMNEHENLS